MNFDIFNLTLDSIGYSRLNLYFCILFYLSMRRFILVILISIICFSCINNTNNTNVSKVTEESNFPSDKLEFSSYADSTTYHIANNDTMPYINISVNITYPLATGVSNNDNLLIKDFISEFIGKETFSP